MHTILKSISRPGHELPAARVSKPVRLGLIWLVPIVAAIAAGVLVYQSVRAAGPMISIQFEDGDGLLPNQTVLRFRGVRIGAVKSVRLTPDAKHVRVMARLDRGAADLARAGTMFWIIHPEMGSTGFHGLQTIVSGVYIQAQPGNARGAEQKDFVGVENAPIVPPVNGGVEYVLRTPGVGSLNEGSPVYYRGMQVGSLEYVGLAEESTSMEVHVLIQSNYAPLVRSNSVWWNAGGVNLSLRFSGISLGAENAKSVVFGGIAFATPPEPGPVASPRTVFPLHDRSEERWLRWAPRIPITNAIEVAPIRGLGPVNLENLGQSGKKSP